MMYLASTLEEDLNIENPTFIEELFSTFNWKDIAQQMISASVRILFTLVVFFIINLIAKWAIEEGFNRFVKKNNQVSNRYETIYRVIKNVYHAIFYFFLIYTILEILNFPVGSLLASAGFIGLAVSLGAQGFVYDLVNGFIILSGKQLYIGHVVIVDIVLVKLVRVD